MGCDGHSHKRQIANGLQPRPQRLYRRGTRGARLWRNGAKFWARTRDLRGLGGTALLPKKRAGSSARVAAGDGHAEKHRRPAARSGRPASPCCWRSRANRPDPDLRSSRSARTRWRVRLASRVRGSIISRMSFANAASSTTTAACAFTAVCYASGREASRGKPV